MHAHWLLDTWTGTNTQRVKKIQRDKQEEGEKTEVELYSGADMYEID